MHVDFVLSNFQKVTVKRSQQFVFWIILVQLQVHLTSRTTFRKFLVTNVVCLLYSFTPDDGILIHGLLLATLSSFSMIFRHKAYFVTKSWWCMFVYLIDCWQYLQCFLKFCLLEKLHRVSRQVWNQQFSIHHYHCRVKIVLENINIIVDNKVQN